MYLLIFSLNDNFVVETSTFLNIKWMQFGLTKEQTISGTEACKEQQEEKAITTPRLPATLR